MKRGQPLQRRTPLVARTELRRSTPLQSRAVPLHRTPLKPISDKRRRKQPARAAAEKALGRDHTLGVCARCLGHTYVNGHERRARSQGGDQTRPDCLLCIACNRWCEDAPRVACWTGWKVSPKWPHDPQLEVGQAFDLFGHVINFQDRSNPA